MNPCRLAQLQMYGDGGLETASADRAGKNLYWQPADQRMRLKHERISKKISFEERQLETKTTLSKKL